jgi:hypothetical protein
MGPIEDHEDLAAKNLYEYLQRVGPRDRDWIPIAWEDAHENEKNTAREMVRLVAVNLPVPTSEPPKAEQEMSRANFIGAPQFFNLNQACRVIVDAFGCNLYLVGSSMKKRDYRDVDLRLILDDEDFDRMFPGIHEGMRGAPSRDARWSLFCSSISEYLATHSCLPIDFQIQRRTEANNEYGAMHHPRNAIGIFIQPKEEE